MSEPAEQPASGPSRWRSLSGKGIVLRLVVLVFVVALVCYVLQSMKIIRMSVVDAVMAFLLAGIGVIAGMIAAGQRKKGNVPSAYLGYRIAVWCLFLALVQALAYQNDREDERTKEIQQILQQREQEKGP